MPRFITQTVQQGYKTVVQPVTRWVSRTVWEPLKKWIPGLGWLAEKVKKTVVEPVTRFVTKTVPNYVTRTVQAGWNFVTPKSWASFRAQERASASLPPKEQPKPWWEGAKDWGQQHVVQPMMQPILIEAAVSVQSQWKIGWVDSTIMR